MCHASHSIVALSHTNLLCSEPFYGEGIRNQVISKAEWCVSKIFFLPQYKNCQFLVLFFQHLLPLPLYHSKCQCNIASLFLSIPSLRISCHLILNIILPPLLPSLRYHFWLWLLSVTISTLFWKFTTFIPSISTWPAGFGVFWRIYLELLIRLLILL